MKILLVSLNSQYVHLSPAPYALAAGVAAYAAHPHEVRICDATVNEPIADVLERIKAESPALIGFCCYIWNITEVKKLVPSVAKALPDCPIILGGPEVAYNASAVLSALPEVTAILSGEGEMPFALLCDAISEGKSLADVPGCSFRTESGIRVAEPYIACSTPPSPCDAGYAEAARGRIAYIETSRGCPFSCVFCLSGRCGGVRFFDLEKVGADLLKLASCGCRTVKFVDRTFNADRARAREIWNFLLCHRGKEIPENMTFHFEIAGELLDEESFALLADAPRGYFRMEVGLQSFHVPTLRAIRRSDRTEKLEANIRRLVALDTVVTHVDLIAGLPEEDLATFRQSFDRAYQLGAQMLQLGFLKRLHGSPLEEEKFPGEYQETPPYTVRATPCLSGEDLAVIQKAEIGCDRLYNSHRYDGTLAVLLRNSELSPFDLMTKAGEILSALPVGYTQAQEIAALYRFFTELSHTDGEEIRDALLLDYIAKNSSGVIPPALRREDGRLHRAHRLYGAEGTRRTVVLLYADTLRVAVADHKKKDPLTGKYPVFIAEYKEEA